MSSDPAPFSFIVHFEPGEGDPRRVFRAADALISAFDAIDGVLLTSIGHRIESRLKLENIIPGSLRVILRNVLMSVDEDALKSGDWKKIVGSYLVQMRRKALQFTDNPTPTRPGLEVLKDEIEAGAAATDVRHIPDYTRVDDAALIGSLDRLQQAKQLLLPQDRLFLEYKKDRMQANLTATGLISEMISSEELDEKTHYHEMILGVRKPDFLRETMWSFSYAQLTISATVQDQDWLGDFHRRRISLMPGDALRCQVRVTYSLDRYGHIAEKKFAVLKVHEVLKGSPGIAVEMPLD